ncbi:putative trancriptional regulator, ArsR family [Halanaeroarchaeum sp. HSR-CO]|uniref:DUF7344 domain-containing protein n=1 Tax=Halanaeroarchaeum sp. HSR-CO TaxID=2866382 RepID=UPI00217CDDA4|nr:hypothetical protein [Halanaeroarchaeum sp. HSR-CO]UWG47960.1 putative trancriptional regulator, ArsR family [Halanaeroarchaeum sp. HSR-CO]
MATESSRTTQPGPEQPAVKGTDEEISEGETCETDDFTADEPDDEAATSLSLDVAFDIVKNKRRRLVLEYLAEREEPVALGELAEHIAAIENDKEVKAINSSERKRVYVGLYQCHLPKMDAAGVVESERNSNITLGKNAPDVMKYVDVPEEQRPWHQYYFGLSVLGLLAVVVAGASGFGTISSMLPGAVLLAVLVTAAVHSTTTDA